MTSATATPPWTGPADHLPLTPGRPKPPTEDPFYRPPLGWEAAERGTVLRSRDVEVALLGRVGQQIEAVQLLYRTADMNGDPSTTVTTVLSATGAEGSGALATGAEATGDEPGADRPLLSYQSAIDALLPAAFPSYVLRKGAPMTGEVPQLELLLVAAALARGWAVAMPDHEGPQGNWGSPREPGHCILDGIRAATTVTRFGLSSRSPAGLWGYSGGGWATCWAAELATEYAGEIDLVGAVLGSPVGDPERVFRRANGHLFAGLVGVTVGGLVRVYPAMRELVEEHVDARGLALLERISSMPTAEAIRRFAFLDFGTLLDIPLDAFLGLPVMREVFAEIRPGQTTPDIPLLVMQAVHDQIVPVDAVDDLVAGLQERGAHVTYVRDRLSEHFSLHAFSGGMSLDWLADRYAGRPVDPPSTSTVWTVLASVGRLRTGVRMLGIAGRVIRGARIA